MPIIGHSIRSLNAVRKPSVSNSIDINSVPKIVEVKEKRMEVLDNKGQKQLMEPMLEIEFEFQTDYKPDVGMIKIAGEIIYTGQDNKKALKEWDKNKRLPREVDIEVKNFLLRKCLLLEVNISQEMQLPPPIVIPMIREKEDKKEPDYIG